jgi:hypothetical protein
MTIIKSGLQENNLLQTSQISNGTSAYPAQSKISNSFKLYLGPGSTNVPGITNLFHAPYEFFNSIKAVVKADKIDDYEGVVENGLRVVSTPFTFLNSLSQLALYIIKGGLLFKVISGSLRNSLAPLSIYISSMGFVMCAIEGFLEASGLIRTAWWHADKYPSDLESLKKVLNISDPTRKHQECIKLVEQFSKKPSLSPELKNQIETFLKTKDSPNEGLFNKSNEILNQIEENVYLNGLNQLQRNYFQISPENQKEIEDYVQNKLSNLAPKKQQEIKEKLTKVELKRAKIKLIRRVQPWLADEIEQTIPGIIQDLQSRDLLKRKEAKEKAAEIFENIKTQSHKKLLIHGIGLAAVLITTAGLILGCIACPFFIPAIVMTIGGILALARSCLNSGYIDSKGWEFKPENCIPSFIKSIYKKMVSKKGEKTSESTLSTFQWNTSRNRDPFARRGCDYTITVPL